LVVWWRAECVVEPNCGCLLRGREAARGIIG
jgi:hypothetical protein